MAARSPASTASTFRSRRARLLGGSALGAALLLAATAQAQTLPGIPDAGAITVATGGTAPTITAPDANSLDIDLKSTRTVINWDSFHVSGADKVTFHFGATSDIVLNKSPTQVKVDAGGQVIGLVGADPGGNIWFYSPQGVVISPGAVMSAGNFVFARGDDIVDMAFVDAASPLAVLRSASDSLIKIDTITSATSASINDEGELVLSASSGDLVATTALAAKGATITTDAGAIDIGEVTAGETASVTATGGDITLASLNGGTGASASGDGTVTVTSASSGDDIAITGATAASLGSGAADGDISVGGPAASLGSATAGGDVFVTATTGDASVTGIVSAGDDIEVTATTGSVTASGGTLTSTGDGASGGDAHVLVQSTGGDATVGTAQTLGTGGGVAGDVTVEAAGAASLTSGASSQDLKVTGETASLGSGAASRDAIVTATDDAEVTGTVSAGGNTTVTATGDATVSGSISADGDATVTAGGTVVVSGAISAGDDVEVTASGGSVNAGGGDFTSTGANADDDAHVTIKALSGAATVGSATTQGTGGDGGDVRVEATTTATLSDGNSTRDVHVLGPSAVLGSADAAGDVFVTGTTGDASVTGVVTAGDDIEVTTTAGSVNAADGELTSTGVGAGDDAHILAKSTSGAVTVGSATTQGTGAALGDVTIESPTSATLGAGGSSRDLRVSGQAATLGSFAAGGDVFVTATTGAASVTGAVTAGDDIEVTATTGSVTAAGGSLTSTGVGASDDAHILAKSTAGSVNVGSATTQGTGVALGDVTIDGATAATLGAGGSSRDLSVLGPAATLGSVSAGRDLFVTATTGDASVTGTSSAGRDATVSTTGGNAGVTGNLSAGRDAFVTTSAGDASVSGSVSAGDDVEVTSASGGVTATGSLTSTGVGASDDAHVLARATSGAVTVGSATTQGTGAAAGDVMVEGATSAQLGAATSSRDIKVTGSAVSLDSGDAARDVLVTASSGNAIVTGAVTGGDDIEVTTTAGAVTAGGASLTSTGVGASDDAHVLVKSASGAVTLGSATTQGAGARAGDVTVDGATTATVTGTLRASQDVVVQATDAVTAGASTMIANRDVSVRSANTNVTVGTVRAGDDVALRALTGSVIATGDLRSGTTAGSSDPAGAADTLAGATLTGHDLDIKAQTVAVTGDAAAGRVPAGGETLDSVQLASDVIVSVTNTDPSGAVAALRLSTGVGKTVSAHGDIVLRAENPAASSIQTGDVFAGRDVAIYSAAGNITMRSALAGDDVVLRAPSGLIEVTGDVQAGRDTPGAPTIDAPGAGDDLNLALPLLDFDGNPATLFKVAGFDVSLVSQAVRITGSTVAGRQPSTDDPDTAGPVDNSTSDVRIQTRLSMTPVSGLAPNIELGAVTATRDIQIDSAKAVVTGDLKAGRDIAVLGRGAPTPGAAANDHTGAGVTIASARAGDDALAFSVYGRTQILGGVTSGVPFARLPVNIDRVTDGATEAADQLAIYLRYFDLDEESAPLVLTGAVVRLAGQGVTVGGNLAAQGMNSDVRVRSSLDINVMGSTTSAGAAIFQTDLGGGAVKVGAVTAARDVFLDGASAEATGTLKSTGGDVAVRARNGGEIRLAGIDAGDDVVLRTTGTVTVGGPVSAGGAADSAGLGDDLRLSDGAITVEGQTFDLTGADVDITGASVTTTGAIAAASDVRVQSAGVLNLGDLSAGRDVLADGATTVSTGMLSAGRDVGVRSTGAGALLTVGGASAGDDVVIRAKGAIEVTGDLAAGGGADSSDADQAGDLMFGVAKSSLGSDFDLVGRTIDVRSSAGAITLSGAATATTDVRVQTEGATGGAVTVGDVTAGRDLLLDGAGVEATGTLTSDGDVAVRGRDGGAVTLAGVAAGDDLVVRTTGGATIAGPVATGDGADGAGLGDTLTTLDGAITLEGQTFGLAGGAVDVIAGSVTTTGLMTAAGTASDIRVRSGGAIGLGAATAGRDVLVEGAAAVSTGALAAGRDVGVRSTGDGAMVTVGSAVAGDDIVVRAKGAIRVTGALSTSGPGADSADADQAGDLMFTAAKTRLAGDLDLVGRTIDLRSSAGSIQVTGAVTAATDARFQTEGATGGSVKVANVTAGRDVLLDGGGGMGVTGAEATGTLMATAGDVAVRGRDGAGIRLKAVTAGDDVAFRTSGSLMTDSTVATMGAGSSVGVADRLADAAEGGRLSIGGLTFDLSGSDIDVVGGAVNIFRSAARGSARIKAGAASMNGGAAAGVDILIDSDISLTVGDLMASGDIALRSRSGSLTVGSLTAGDDIVLRGAQGVTAVSLKVTGLFDGVGAGDQLALADPIMLGEGFSMMGGAIDVRALGGAISIGSAESVGDVRLQAMAGEVNISGLVTAGRDILADGAGVNANGALNAAGDIALYARTGAVTVGSASAGDDIVTRAFGDVTATGELKSGQGADTAGVADRLITATGPTGLFGAEVGAEGGVIDVSGANIRLSGQIQAAGESAHLRLRSTGTTILGDATLTGDIAIDAVGDVTGGALSAGRDLAVRSTEGAVSIASGAAGDDIVLRAARAITVQGALSVAQGSDVQGFGDVLFNLNRTNLGGDFTLTGRSIDLLSTGGDVTAGGLTAADDVRVQAADGRVSATDVDAGRDVLLDGGSVTAGAVRAGGDLAVRASNGALTLGSGRAGDDLVLRAQGDVTITGALEAGGGTDADGAGDRLATLDGGAALEAGRHADLQSSGGGVSVQGALTAADDIRLRTAGTVTIAGRLDAGRDVRAEAGAIAAAGEVKAARDVLLKSAGTLSAGKVDAGRDVRLDAGGTVTAGELIAGRDVLLQTTGEATTGKVTAAQDVTLRADGSITTTGEITAGRDALLRAGGSVTTAGRLAAGRDATLRADGAVAITGTVEAGQDVLLDAGGDVATGSLRAGRDLTLKATGAVTTTRQIEGGRDVMLDGASVTGGAVRATRDVAARGRTGAVTLGSVTAGDDVVLRAAQGVTVTGAITARGGADDDGAADRLFAEDRTALAGDFDLAGANIDVRGGAISVGGAATAGRDARFQTKGDAALSLGTVTAGGDILADGREVKATGQLSAGRDVAVRARAGGVELASVTAGDDIAIRASGGVKASGAMTAGSGANAQGAADRLISAGEGGAIMRLVDPMAATATVEGFALAAGDVDIRSGEAIALSGDVGAANIRLQAATKITLASATAADSIFARGADFSLGGAWRATKARIEVTAASLNLGEGATGSGGLTLSSEQLGRIDAPVVQIFLGDTSGTARGGNLSIGTLAVDTAKIRTSLELYAGGLSDVLITGAFAPSGSGANTTSVRIGAPDAAGNWTPRSIRVVANSGGSIGAATTTGGRTFTDVRAFNVIELNAKTDILMGYQDFIDRLAMTSAASVPQAVKSIIAPQTTTGPRILVTAGTLILRADGKVAQQDTGGLLGTTPTGLYLLGAGTPQLVLGRTSATPGLPEFIELNGALTSGTTIMTGDSVSLLAGIAFDRGVAPSGYYRLNTCAILQQGSCMPSNGHPTISIPPEQLTGLTLEDRTAAAGAADPTVASATNEEVWKDTN